VARTVAPVRAVVLVQLRHATELTSEQYTATEGWRSASLPCCPEHPEGGCGFARHGTYSRSPSGTKIARWDCRKARRTFSLLPDCLPARFGGTLPDLEQVVAQREQLGVEAAANQLRPPDDHDAITLESAVRWVRRRAQLVHAGLRALIGLFPELFAGVQPSVTALREHMHALLALNLVREIAAAHLDVLPPPLGFGPRPQPRGVRAGHLQHSTGTDPP